MIVKYTKDEAVCKEICNNIQSKIEYGDIEVDGFDYDRKGWYEGYDYSDTYIPYGSIEKIYLIKCEIVKGICRFFQWIKVWKTD